MSNAILAIAGAMFSIPLVVMVAIAALGADIPSFILWTGGWSMALGVVAAGIAAIIGLVGG